MSEWAVIIPADRWATERLFHHDTVSVPSAEASAAVLPDDEVLLVVDGGVVALARAAKTDGDRLVLTYLRRFFDEPLPADELGTVTGVTPVDPAVFRRLTAGRGSGSVAGQRRTWLVSVAMPIEADTPADAVRQFWSHAQELGPVELPTYVWPSGDELSMQAFVLGEEANQDPEEEDDED